MRAFTLDSFDTPPGLREDLPTPQIGPDQLLVRVQASSVNPVDAFVAAGDLKGMAEHEFPVVLGRDYAGVVEQAGRPSPATPQATRSTGGVLHANPTVHDGSWAELIVVPHDQSVARRPASVDVARPGPPPGRPHRPGRPRRPGAGRARPCWWSGPAAGWAASPSSSPLTPAPPCSPPASPRTRIICVASGPPRSWTATPTSSSPCASATPTGSTPCSTWSPRPRTLNAYAAVVRDGGRIASASARPARARVAPMSAPSPAVERLERLAGLLTDGTLTVPIQASYPLAQAHQALKALTGSTPRASSPSPSLDPGAPGASVRHCPLAAVLHILQSCRPCTIRVSIRHDHRCPRVAPRAT